MGQVHLTTFFFLFVLTALAGRGLLNSPIALILACCGIIAWIFAANAPRGLTWRGLFWVAFWLLLAGVTGTLFRPLR